MANFEALKTLIRQYIKENGDGEITGDILQSVLIAMVTEVEGNGYVYAGIATPTTEPVTGNVFYIATEAGSYSNFGSVDVSAGITILKRDGSSWTKNQICYTDGVFDISAYNGSSYANLSAALGPNGANVPLAVRHNGMEVSYKDSDGVYHQFRYMKEYANTTAGNTAFVNVSNWQGVDIEPIFQSKNIVESNGILNAIVNNREQSNKGNFLLGNKIDGNIDLYSYAIEGLWLSGGNYDASLNSYSSCIIPVFSYKSITILSSNKSCYYAFLTNNTYPESGRAAAPIIGNRETIPPNTEITIPIPIGAKYMWVSLKSKSGGCLCPTYVRNSYLKSLVNDVDALSKSETIIDYRQYGRQGLWVENNHFIGNDGRYYSYLIPIGNIDEFTIKANSENSCQFALFSDKTSQSVVIRSIETLLAGKITTITRPSTANYLWISGTTRDYDSSPAFVSAYSSVIKSEDIISDLEMTSCLVNGRMDLFSHSIKGLYLSGDRWQEGVIGYNSAIIPLENINRLILKTNPNYSTFYAFLSNDSHESGTRPSYVGSAGRITLAPSNAEYTIDVPNGATHLWISLKNPISETCPTYIYTNLSFLSKITHKPSYLFYADFKNGDYNGSDFQSINGNITSGQGLVLTNGVSNILSLNRPIILDEYVYSIDFKTINNTEIICLTSKLSQNYSATAITTLCVDFSAKKLTFYKRANTQITPNTGEVAFEADITDIISGNIYTLILNKYHGNLEGILYNRTTGAVVSVLSEEITEAGSIYGGNLAGYMSDNPSLFVHSGSPYIESLYGTCNLTPSILFIGDSITRGSHNLYSESWAGHCAEFYGNSLVAGRGSGDIDCCINVLNSLMKTITPKVVVVTIGTNELNASSSTKDAVRQKFDTIVRIIKENNAMPIINNICNCESRLTAVTTVNEVIDELGVMGAKFNLATSINNDWSQGQNSSLYYTDGVHLNQAGNQKLFEYFTRKFPNLKFI